MTPLTDFVIESVTNAPRQTGCDLCSVETVSTGLRKKRKNHEKMVAVWTRPADAAMFRWLKTAMHVQAMPFLNTTQPVFLTSGY